MVPRNGASGTSMSAENCATLRLRSNLMILGVGAVSTSVSTPVRGPGIVHAVGHAEIELMDADLQHVALLRPFDIDRTGQHVHAGAVGVRRLRVDIDRVLEHLLAGDPGAREEADRVGHVDDALVRDGVDADRLARANGERGRHVGREIAPDDGLRRRAQGVIGRGLGRHGLGPCRTRAREKRGRHEAARQSGHGTFPTSRANGRSSHQRRSGNNRAPSQLPELRLHDRPPLSGGNHTNNWGPGRCCADQARVRRRRSASGPARSVSAIGALWSMRIAAERSRRIGS